MYMYMCWYILTRSILVNQIPKLCFSDEPSPNHNKNNWSILSSWQVHCGLQTFIADCRLALRTADLHCRLQTCIALHCTVDSRLALWTADLHCGLQTCTVDCRLALWTADLHCGLQTCTVDCRLALWTADLHCGLQTCTVDCRLALWKCKKVKSFECINAVIVVVCYIMIVREGNKTKENTFYNGHHI